jgi:hypothetical protein
MSTEHLSEHDIEYGPTPPGAKYEHTDIDVAVGYKFALWLAVAMIISIAIVYGTFWFFEGQARSGDERAQKYPLAAAARPAMKPGDPQHMNVPPGPNLQTQPFQDVYQLRAVENKKLGEYGWVDKDGGVTHIPIERAMEVMLQRGFPTRADAPVVGAVTQDSSSGRTTAPR